MVITSAGQVPIISRRSRRAASNCTSAAVRSSESESSSVPVRNLISKSSSADKSVLPTSGVKSTVKPSASDFSIFGSMARTSAIIARTASSLVNCNTTLISISRSEDRIELAPELSNLLQSFASDLDLFFLPHEKIHSIATDAYAEISTNQITRLTEQFHAIRISWSKESGAIPFFDSHCRFIQRESDNFESSGSASLQDCNLFGEKIQHRNAD